MCEIVEQYAKEYAAEHAHEYLEAQKRLAFPKYNVIIGITE